MSFERALRLSQEATVQTVDGRILHARLIVGSDSPVPETLDDFAFGGLGILDLVAFAAVTARDVQRWLRYRLSNRQDWWLVHKTDDEEPVATRHATLSLALASAEELLTEAIAAGGTYLPYGRQQR